MLACIEQVTGTSCTKDCETFNKYDASLSTSYSKDGTSFTQSYEDGTEATGIPGSLVNGAPGDQFYLEISFLKPAKLYYRWVYGIYRLNGLLSHVTIRSLVGILSAP